MAGGKKRVIHPAIPYLGAIEFVTNAGVIGHILEALFQILKGGIGCDHWQRDRFAVSLRQLVGSAKIIFAGLVFRDAKPGMTKPYRMFVNGAGNCLGIAAFRPKREEREFFCFTER